jgi:hypothetical protein
MSNRLPACSSLISTLFAQQLPLRQWTIKLEPWRGLTGPTMPENAVSAPRCDTFHDLPSRPTSLPLPQGFELKSLGTRSKLDIKMWKRALHHVAQTHLLAGYDDPRYTCRAQELDMPSGTIYSKATGARTRPHDHNWPSP